MIEPTSELPTVENIAPEAVSVTLQTPEAANMLTPAQQEIMDKLLRTSKHPQGAKQPDFPVAFTSAPMADDDLQEGIGDAAPAAIRSRWFG